LNIKELPEVVTTQSCSFDILSANCPLLNNLAAISSLVTMAIAIVWTCYLILDKERFLSGRWEGEIDNKIDENNVFNINCTINFTRHKNLPVKGMLYYSCKCDNNNYVEGLDELDNSHTIEKFKFDEEFFLKFTRRIHINSNGRNTDTQQKYNWSVKVKKAQTLFLFKKKYEMTIKVSMEGTGHKMEGTMHKVQ